MPNASVTEAMRPGRKPGRRGQSAVETMMMAFGIAVILVAMFHLFTVTWASSNAHMRAREAVLHGSAYLDGTRMGYTSVSSTPFDSSAGTYEIARPDNDGAFKATANDTTRDDLIGSQDIRVEWTILRKTGRQRY